MCWNTAQEGQQHFSGGHKILPWSHYGNPSQIVDLKDDFYMMTRYGVPIHSKSKKSLLILLFSLKKSAEKVHKSRRQHFATKVRKSIKSLRNA